MMSLKKAKEEILKDINAVIATRIFKAKGESLNCKINSGTNMFTANKQQLS